MHAFLPLLAAGGVINVGTNATGLPGSAEVLSMLSGLRWYAVAICVIGVLIAAAAWAVGSHSDNLRWAHKGRLGVIVGVLSALIVGATPMLVNFFYGAGAAAH
jgi:uncharacterized membrane protein YwaF